MAQRVYILNGPNLDLLGQREPELYGHDTLADLESRCLEAGSALGYEVRFLQSNAEHVLIDWIHEAMTEADGIVINAAALTHTSIAIHDALRACPCPVIEVHLSNVHAREPFRHVSYVAPVAAAVLAGCGLQGYEFALERLSTLTRPH